MRKLIILIFFITRCSNIKMSYDSDTLKKDNQTIIFLEKFHAEDRNKSLVIFTSGFDSDHLIIKNDSKTIFDKKLSTIEQLGFSEFVVLSNDYDGNLNFSMSDKEKLTFNLKKNKLRTYKFIYISRDLDTKRLLINFSNKLRKFI